MKCFLEAVREQKLPTDLLPVLDDAGVVYYDGSLLLVSPLSFPFLLTFPPLPPGCLIVEVHDHRQSPPPTSAPKPSLSSSFSISQTREVPSASKAEVYRIVLAPNPGTLWTELGIMSRRIEEEARAEGRDDVVGWTEEEALEIEAVILVRSLPPCPLPCTR